MASNLYEAMLMGLLSGFGYPMNGNCSSEKKEPPVKIVAYCTCRDVTDEEENKDVLDESKNL